MIALLLLALQTAPVGANPPPAPPKSERWSILVPTPDQPCVPASDRETKRDDIVICATNRPSPRLPDPASVPSSGPVPSNRYMTGSGALAAQATPCPISRECVVGFGPPIVPMIKGAVDLARRAFAKKPDKTGRVPIPLDDSDPPTGRLLP
ncbi:hypothetical protein [Sphingomonas sp.]|jgi:hypothetical protein|uniref:hypothetical protein n=1 Tax=Sphingomonas sp. TaxID=28214 RepID=UPI002E2FE09F|nr:hypothetical protein [Sphingomonas sp.]HEX4694957.1 hypothetical protein [Sphingomonas sp.]